MRTSFRNMASCALLALVALVVASPVQAQMTAQERAARHALNGPEVKKLKVLGHEFNVKRARLVRTANGTTITGQLSHHLSFRDDDQLYYTIKKSSGKVMSIEIKIDRGGLAPYVSKLAGKIVGVDLFEKKVESLVRDFGARFDGNWESAADVIVASIALMAPDDSAAPRRPVVRPLPVTRVPGLGTPTTSEGPIVRDHRTPMSEPVVRDHRTPSRPIVRDHRSR